MNTKAVRLPEFITFTGADDRTDTVRMSSLSQKYPIEWAILFSPSKQGVSNRYPLELPSFIINERQGFFKKFKIAAHLCGRYTSNIMQGQKCLDQESEFQVFDRIQINHTSPSTPQILDFSARLNSVQCIAQWRNLQFPVNNQVQWLFDKSGGRGESPSAWPEQPFDAPMRGFAGGINPLNVNEVLIRIAAQGPYWIDMETGVRTDDWFDLDKVQSVCEQVYGY